MGSSVQIGDIAIVDYNFNPVPTNLRETSRGGDFVGWLYWKAQQ